MTAENAPEPFWNLTNGRRPPEPIPGLYASVCESTGHVLDDPHFGPRECARCGFTPARRRWWQR